MTARLDYIKAAPQAARTLWELEQFLSTTSGLDPRLIHLLKLRASQINGCAYCVDMHTKEARKDGLSEQWIALVSVWPEANVFTPRERALLGWTEALTRISKSGAPDPAYDDMRAHFSDADIAHLSVAIGLINLWNRLAIGFRTPHPVDAAA